MSVAQDLLMPLSSAQRGIWYAQQLAPDSPAFHIATCTDIRGPLDLTLFEAAVRHAVDETESLQIRVVPDGDAPWQVVAPVADWSIPIVDLRSEPDPVPVAEDWMSARLVEPFDLFGGPLFRHALLRIGDEHWLWYQGYHHLALDAFSIAMIKRRIAKLYTDALDGLPWTRESRGSLRDLLAEEAAYRESPQFAADAEFWARRIDGRTDALTVGSGQAGLADRVLRHTVRVPKSTMDNLLAVTRRPGPAIVAATAACLSRLAGRPDIVLSLALTGRTTSLTRRLPAMLSNVLPIRLRVDRDTSGADLVERAEREIAAALRHQRYRGEVLRREFRAPDTGRRFFGPLVNVVPSDREVRFGGLKTTGRNLSTMPVEDLSVVAYPAADGGMRVDFDANAAVLGTAELAEHAERVIAQLDALATRPARPIRTTETDEALALIALGTGAPATEPSGGLVEAFAQVVARKPDACAVVAGEQEISYAELDRRSTAFARELRASGVGAETPVGLLLSRSPELVVAVLAVLKAGGAYVPLDNRYPLERMRAALRTVGTSILVVDATTRNHELTGGNTVLDVSRPVERTEPVAWQGHPDRLAYVMFTSGSTGVPKGVATTHGDVLALASDSRYRNGAHQRVLHYAPHAFDASTYELWVPLLAGGQVVVAPREDLNPRTLRALVERHGITAMWLTAGLFGVLADLDPGCLIGLREVWTGGDVVPPGAVARVLTACPGLTVVNGYGPTETTTFATSWPVRDPADVADGMPIGRPLDGMRIYLLDEDRKLVPRGAVGELYIAGAGLARGYFGRPDLTAQRFLPDPYGPPGGRMYRTGDLARWRSDGALVFAGRADDQVKIRGFRVELGEIEAVLAGHPGVAQAAAVITEDPGGTKRLAAYVVPSAEPAAAADGVDQVGEWRQLYESLYSQAPAESIGENFVGWTSSYDNKPIPAEQMIEWRDATVTGVRSLRPRRVLEIGVGTGLLLASLAPDCEEYWGTDLSAEVIERLARQVAAHPELASRVQLRCQPADDTTGLPEDFFDTVVLNSVVQYFPSADYLGGVVRAALRLVRPGGAVFVGDVRHHGLHRMFRTAVELSQARGTDPIAVRGAIERSLLLEKELLLAPEFFTLLSDAVDVRIKRARFGNEMSRYRYDVVLRADAAAALSVADAPTQPWPGDLDTLADLLSSRPPMLRVTGIPNRRLLPDAIAGRLLAEHGDVAQARRALNSDTGQTEEPDALGEAGERLGYHTAITFSGADGSLDAVFVARDLLAERMPVGTYRPVDGVPLANDPAVSHRLSVLTSDLRGYLEQRLPDYMVPTAVVALDRLPLTANGKLDRRALPAPETRSAAARREPRSAEEQVLCRLFGEVLGLGQVGIDDDFFDLGGNSLLATRLVSRIRSTLGIELAIAAVFDSPTVAVLAERGRGTPGVRTALRPMRRPARVPLSFGQRGLWFLHRMEGPSPTYNVPLVLRLTGPVLPDALRAAVVDVVARHESMRTTFESTPDGSHQVVAEVARPFVEFRQADRAELPALLAESSRYPFDLAAVPPLRVLLFTVAPEEHTLLLLVHHIAADGWSLAPLIRDLATAYRARCEGTDPGWAPLPIQYADYTLWQAEMLGDPADPDSLFARQLSYWRATLSGAPAELPLPTDRPRPEHATHDGASVPVTIDAELHERLSDLANRTRTTVFMLLQAAVATLLARHGAGSDIPLGSPIAGRSDQAFEDLVGLFVNTLVYRIDLSGEPTFRELLDRIRQTDLAAFAHQDLPFEALVAELNPDRSAGGRHPLFQVVLSIVDGLPAELALHDLRARVEPSNSATAKFDLAFLLYDRRSGDNGAFAGLTGEVEYSTDLFDRATVVGFVGELVALLDAMVTDPDAQALPGGTAPERSVAPPPTLAHRSATLTDTGRVLAELWSTLLSVDRPGAADSFFDLGGNSLLALTLQARITERFGVEISLRVMFQFPVLADLADRIDAEVAGNSTVEPFADNVFPVSSFQRRVWLAERLGVGGGVYNVPLWWRLSGRVDVEVLGAALGVVVARHEVLRSRFLEENGGLVRVAGPGWIPEVELVSGVPVGELVRGEGGFEFDVESGRLVRAVVAELADGSCLLGLNFHHLVCDGASIPVILRDLDRAYRELEGDRPTTWTEFPAGRLNDAQLAELGARMMAWLGKPADDEYASHLAALACRLHGEFAAVHHTSVIQLQLPGELASTAEREGVGVDAVLLAGLVALLSWYLGQTEFVVVVRDEVPVRLRANPDQSFAATARRIAAELTASRRHSDVSLDDLAALFGTDFGLRFTMEADGTATIDFGEPSIDPDSFRTHYQRLLTAACAEPDTELGQFEPLTDDERHAQLVTYNDTAADYPQTTLHELIRARAQEKPDAIALTLDGEHRSYADLLDRAEGLARGLVAVGVRPGELVGLVLGRGHAQVEAILAVLLAGAAYLPIDPAAPEQRVEFILDDAQARWVIVAGDTVAHPGLTELAGRTLLLDELAALGDDEVALPPVTPDAPCYCIYTSGSTGTPKGVLVSHRNVIRLLVNDRNPFEFGPDDVWTMFHAYTFDFSVWELFGCLVHGGRLVLVGDGVAGDTERFWRLIRDERVTVLNQTPTAFARLDEQRRAAPAPLDHLRYVIFGGERLRPGTLADWARSCPAALVNMYGITETTVHVTFRLVTREDITHDISNVGGPIPTTTAYLLDPLTRHRLLPPGALGEIHVGGDGVAAGYLRRPELTEERFVPNPYGPGRLFRTGDLARYRPDGTLEFAGRADDQIKLRGYRIEPGEIEARLREHPAVAQAVVLLDTEDAPRLVAFVRCPGNRPTRTELHTHLAATLPAYMIPAAFRSVERIPLTSNGKTDVRMLWTIGESLDDPVSAVPLTETGEVVAELWSELLEVARPGVDDSFFDLGGHSVLAATVVSRLTERLGVAVPLRTIFDNPRLGDLADALDELRANGTRPVVAPEIERDDILPASNFQRRVWLAERLGVGGGVYNVPLWWRLSEPVDVAALGAALSVVVARHEVLRSRFVEVDGSLVRVVGPAWTPEVDVVSGVPVGELVRGESGFGFDVGSGRLVRAVVAELDDGSWLLGLNFHHLVCDGASIPVILRDLDRAYTGAPIGDALVQFRDFVAAQQETSDSGLDYWTEALHGAPSRLRLGTGGQGSGGALTVPVSDDVLVRLRGVQNSVGVSWFVLVASALAVLLHRWSGQDDVTFGCPVVNRPDGFSDVVGPCVNTVVLRSRVDGGSTVGDVVGSVRDVVLGALEHQGVPFEDVVERLNPPRQPGRTPYIDVALSAPQLGATATLDGIELRPYTPDELWENELKFGLTVTALQAGDRLRVILSYRGEEFTEADIDRAARSLTLLLDTLPDLLDRSVHAIDLPVTPAIAPVSTPARQFRDFVAAQQRFAQTGLGYWADALAGAPSRLRLGSGGSGEHGAVPVPLPDDVLVRLRGVQNSLGVSWFVLVASALAVLLHRWSGQDDVTFGCPVVNRPDGFSDVVGPCVNTVVLRSRVDGGSTVGDVVGSVRDVVLGALEHQGVPFEDVVERLNPPRQPGRTPYIDVALTAEITESRAPVIAGRQLTPMTFADQPIDPWAKFPLTVSFVVADGQLRGMIAYRGDDFTADEVTQAARLLGRLLATLPDRMDQRIAALPLADDAELDRLRRFERGPAAMPPATVPDLIARWTQTAPDAPAIVTDEGELSYRELDQRAGVLAAALRPTLTGSTDPVAVLLMDRGADFVVAALAAWKAGAAFCPIDPNSPRTRIDFIVGDLGASAVLTDHPDRWAALATDRLTVIDTRAEGAEPGPDAALSPDATAYVLYTSGTTGTPKGVAVRQSGLAQLAAYYGDTLDIGPDDRVSQAASVGFDMVMMEVWPALCAGAALLPYQRPVVVAELGGWLNRRGVTVCALPTPVAEAMWEFGPTLSTLRWLTFGGAALTRRPPAGVGYGMRNFYGPTEITVFATAHHLRPGHDGPRNVIGTPITGTSVYVLGSDGERCPLGIAGEIHIGGAGVAAGYWRRPELTAEKFLPHGPDGAPGPVYRTGDLGRWHADGTLEYLGRIDRQIKVRGQRVEPAEIEIALRDDPLVAQAVVVGRPDRSPTLIGYLVASAGAETEPVAGRTRAVLERLRTRLPEYMVPDAVLWLAEIPLLPSGKPDLAALPDPARDDLVGSAPAVSPSTDLERRIAAIWAEVLTVDTVGVHDNFFDLGGNSLLLSALHAKLRVELGGELPVRLLFEHPTVYTLARALGEPETGRDEPVTPDVTERAANARRARAARRPPRMR